MIQIRKRWPILTALAAALAYGVNNYQISGIEHLRLQPRPTTASSNRAGGGGFPAGFSNSQGTGFDLSQFSDQLRSNGFDFGPSGFATNNQAGLPANFDHIPPWRDMLSVGEKMAMWQSNQAARTSESVPTGVATELSLPVASPIPLTIEPLPTIPTSNQLSAAPPNSLPSIPTTLPPTAWPSLDQAPPADPSPAGNLVHTPLTSPLHATSSSPSSPRDRFRLASFNLGGLGPTKLAKPHVVEMLVRILRQYEVIALQEVQSTRDDILPILVERLNQSGRTYDYLIGPRVGRGAVLDQFAFIFETSRIETDRFQLYTVDDPENLMTYDPLVAWFRSKDVAADRAFTFSLVNVRIDPNAADAERGLLPNLIDAVRQDGRQEDDWIILGDLAGSTPELTGMANDTVRFAVRDVPTDVAGQRMLDGLLFSARGTTEFTGRCGAFDFLRKFNLTLENALEVSDHLPIWAEFSTIEGADPGRVAPVDPQAVY
ncbi:MAG: endonuclease/exonuclease/phosphatase family protein [Pirellulaceae bacterium]